MSTLAHTVERSILLDADPEELREALADPEFLREWLGAEVELTVPADREERTAEGDAAAVSFRWHREGQGESQVDLIVDAVAGRVRVTVIETSLEPSATPLLAAAWQAPLASLPRRLGAVRAVLA